MRKDDLTFEQQQDRDRFYNSLQQSNWLPITNINQDFDDGWWVPYLAVLEKQERSINITATYISHIPLVRSAKK